MTRPPSCDAKQEGLKKGPWTPNEDQKLVAYIQNHGHGSWRSLPLNAGLQRCGKSCRLRWTNYLRPDIKRGRFSQDEDQMIIHLHAILGNRWSAIASHLPRRTDNEIKNYWNTHLKKRLLQIGIDPVSHESTTAEETMLDNIITGLRPVVSSSLTHMSQWDCARAEAEARLSRQSSLTSSTSELTQTSHQHQPLNLSTESNVNYQDESTNFMSSWKDLVTETLRPNFGEVELDKTPANPVDLRKFLQDWESSLQAPQSLPESYSTDNSPIDVPDVASGTASEVASPPYSPNDLEGFCRIPGSSPIFPSPAQLTERLMASRHCNSLLLPPRTGLEGSNVFPTLQMTRNSQSLPAVGSSFNFSGLCGADTEHQFSPTSTLYNPDDSSYCSPCGNSDGISDSFNPLAQRFLLIHDNDQLPRANLVTHFPSEQSLWSLQQVDMVGALQPKPYFISELEVAASQKPRAPCFNASVSSMVNQVGLLNDIPIPHFEFLC